MNDLDIEPVRTSDSPLTERSSTNHSTWEMLSLRSVARASKVCVSPGLNRTRFDEGVTLATEGRWLLTGTVMMPTFQPC